MDFIIQGDENNKGPIPSDVDELCSVGKLNKVHLHDLHCKASALSPMFSFSPPHLGAVPGAVSWKKNMPARISFKCMKLERNAGPPMNFYVLFSLTAHKVH